MKRLACSSRVSRAQNGSSLLEVLIAILILSFGLLSLGGIMSYAVQMPKISGNRATAVMLATDMIERIRANKDAFVNGSYTSTLSYDGSTSVTNPSTCSYPNCTSATLATWDQAVFQQQLRLALPGGGYQILPTVTGATTGNLWVLWQEPATFGSFNTNASDNCPVSAAGFTSPLPRCLYIPFAL